MFYVRYALFSLSTTVQLVDNNCCIDNVVSHPSAATGVANAARPVQTNRSVAGGGASAASDHHSDPTTRQSDDYGQSRAVVVAAFTDVRFLQCFFVVKTTYFQFLRFCRL
jgi:hypothetical protein